MDKKVMIACPVQNRQEILPYYLECLYNIDYPKHLIFIYWIINNSNDDSLEILKTFKEQHEHEYNSICIEIFNNKKYPQDERKQDVRVKTYHFLSELRNKILKKCAKSDCDFLFSSDSDILLNKDVLKRLLQHDKKIVANLIYNGYLYTPPDAPKDYDCISNAYKYPNILREVAPRIYQHIVNYKIKNPHTNPVGTLIEVEYSGASILIAKEVCEKARYSHNDTYGEDEEFCFTARQAGYKIFCDISSFQFHVMNKDILEKYLNGELKL